MKKIVQGRYDRIAGMYKYKFAKQTNESIHMVSTAPVAQMAPVNVIKANPELVSDPAQVSGIEIGDEVALVNDPETSVGVLIGITGFRYAIVQDETGAMNEYDSSTVLKFKDKGLEG
jgi:hypothetical protein